MTPIREAEKDLRSNRTTLLACCIWRKVSCVLLGLLLNKDTEGLGLSRDMASTRVAASSGAVPKGTEASFPWLAQPPYTGGSLNESFLPAEAT